MFEFGDTDFKIILYFKFVIIQFAYSLQTVNK